MNTVQAKERVKGKIKGNTRQASRKAVGPPQRQIKYPVRLIRESWNFRFGAEHFHASYTLRGVHNPSFSWTDIDDKQGGVCRMYSVYITEGDDGTWSIWWNSLSKIVRATPQVKPHSSRCTDGDDGM